MSLGVDLEIAEDIRNAYSRGPIPPVSGRVAPGDISAAYHIQSLNTGFWVTQGRRIIGKKIGLTSPVVQQQLGVDQPDYGVLFADMLVEDGGSVDFSQLIAGRIEAEIAMGLKADLLDRDITERDLLAAVSWLAPALEIVDSRIANWSIKIVDTIADNASSAYFVVGRKKAWPSNLDVTKCKMRLSRDGQTVSEGIGANCLGSPFTACLWLARKMAELGNPLKAGEVIMSGALGAMVPVFKGSLYDAEIEGLGSVSVRF